MTSQRARLTARLAVILGIVLWSSASYVYGMYERSRPTVPEAGTGRVFRLVNHGYAFYVTRKEMVTVYSLMGAGAVLVVGGILIGLRGAGATDFKSPTRS